MISNLELTIAANKCIDLGNYKEALEISLGITDPSLKAGILIDAGFGTKRPSTVKEGIYLLETLLNTEEIVLNGMGYVSEILYNLANGYSSVYKLRRERRKTFLPTNDPDLQKAKSLYKRAILEYRGTNVDFHSQLLTNYANCLTQLGRGIEAISFYEKAFLLQPKNGMALGNLGQELEFIARITGKYYLDYLQLAKNYLIHTLSAKGHLMFGPPEAREAFAKTLTKIDQQLASNRQLRQKRPTEYSAIFKWRNRRYIRFCREKHLFLNAWVGDKNLTPAISDEIHFSKLTTPVFDRDTVPELNRILNEIREAFSTARYLFYLALNRTPEKNMVSSMSVYFHPKAIEKNGLYIGLCKSAYLRAFDILDKVARVANVYYGFGNRRNSFWDLFAQRHSHGQDHLINHVARPEIVAQKNSSLFALADLCIEYFESEKADFKTIDDRRNKITHDYLAVVDDQYLGEDNISLEELYIQTENVLKLAKHATLYIVSAINISESKKEADLHIHKVYGYSHGLPFK